MREIKHRLTQRICFGPTPLPFGTLTPSVVTSYILGTLYKIVNFGQLFREIYKELVKGMDDKEVNRNAW